MVYLGAEFYPPALPEPPAPPPAGRKRKKRSSRLWKGSRRCSNPIRRRRNRRRRRARARSRSGNTQQRARPSPSAKEEARVIERITPPGVPNRGDLILRPCARAILFSSRAKAPSIRRRISSRSGPSKHETRLVLSNIRRILEGCGASLADVVKCSVFLSSGKDFAAMNEVYAEFFGAPNRRGRR